VPETFDFEKAWLAKFFRCLEKFAGEEIRDVVMEGSSTPSTYTEPLEIIRWTQGAIQRLEKLVGEKELRSIMTGCSCQYPKSELQDIRLKYEASKDLHIVHRILQEHFEIFLRETLELEEDLVAEVIKKGWGIAGVFQGDTIIATKIPKSEYLVEYLKETNPEKRRRNYCHCPRVRDALALSETLPIFYCYCGAGFYQGMWEEILQKQVEVEILESVLSGGDVCTVVIYLS